MPVPADDLGPPVAGGTVPPAVELESLVRARLRALRQARGWSLDQLAERSHLSPSTISRIETGKRTIGLDVLVALARGLEADLDALLDAGADDDVVIRPHPASDDHRTTWLLSRGGSSRVAIKVRMEPQPAPPAQKVHPGHDWMYVLSGTVRLHLGDRAIEVQAGEAAEFGTMTPHAFEAVGAPAEVLMVFDRDGHRVHVVA